MLPSDGRGRWSQVARRQGPRSLPEPQGVPECRCREVVRFHRGSGVWKLRLSAMLIATVSDCWPPLLCCICLLFLFPFFSFFVLCFLGYFMTVCPS